MGELKREREIEGIETVGALREVFSDLNLVDNVPIGDVFGEPLMVTVYRDTKTAKLSVGIE
ncbi:MAG: hypothetical protein PHO83_03765 [Geobacteraceae bacterium]|nr:hypothetical protein [Geobacteraceae bacterium]